MNGRRRSALRSSLWGLGAAALASPWWARAAEPDLVLGQIGPFTGLPSPDVPQLNLGIRAHLRQLNARGGIRGRQVSLVEFDDGYTADGFVKQFSLALKRRPLALLAPVGSVALKRMLDDKLLDGADVVVLNAIPGAEALRSPGHPKLFHIRAGDRQQIEKIVRHARTLGVTRMAVLYQDIPIGVSGLAVAKETAAQIRDMQITEFKAGVELPSIANAAAAVKASGAPSVLVVGAPRFMADGVTELRKTGRSAFVFALSYVPAPLLFKIAGDAARGVALAQTFPNPNGATLPLTREFQAAMREMQAIGALHLVPPGRLHHGTGPVGGSAPGDGPLGRRACQVPAGHGRAGSGRLPGQLCQWQRGQQVRRHRRGQRVRQAAVLSGPAACPTGLHLQSFSHSVTQSLTPQKDQTSRRPS